jgi:amino acid transporter
MSERARALPRVLGLFDISVLASAAMGPAYSLAATMGLMVAAAGNAATLALVLLSAIMLCIAVAFSRLSTASPNAGSSFSWIAGAFGPAVGTYAAWLLLLSNYFATMSTALPAGIYTLELFSQRAADSPLADALVGTIWIVASTLLLAIGLRPTAIATAVFLIAELAVVLASAVACYVVHPGAEAALPAASITPGFGGVIIAMVLGIWMTDGWEVSASASEEATGARDTPGRGGIIGLVVTVAVLLFAMNAYLRVGSVAGFSAHQADAMSYVADRLGGGFWRIAIVATVLVSTSATLWTTILYLSRSVYAMGRDGVLPRATGTLDARGVPVNSLLVVSFCVSLCTLATGLFPKVLTALNLVVSATSVFLGILFCMSALAAVRSLAGKPGQPLWSSVAVPLAGAVTLLVVIGYAVALSDPVTRWIELAGLALGIPFAFWRGRRVVISAALFRTPASQPEA